jgi:hypothetical protein
MFRRFHPLGAGHSCDRLSARTEIRVPGWFEIDTPVGKYNPDWAIVKHQDETLYLDCETKGQRDFLKRRTSEADKVRCGQKHFDTLGVSFSVVVTDEEVWPMAITPDQIAAAEAVQLAAAHDDSPSVRLVAGPGTGKSSAIEARVCWLLANGAAGQELILRNQLDTGMDLPLI